MDLGGPVMTWTLEEKRAGFVTMLKIKSGARTIVSAVLNPGTAAQTRSDYRKIVAAVNAAAAMREGVLAEAE